MKQLRNQTCHDLMRAAMNQMHLSARGFHRVLKLARTNADLAGAESITAGSPNSLFGPRSWIPRTRKRFSYSYPRVLSTRTDLSQAF